MNTSTTVAAGQIRDEMIANIKTRLMQDAHMMHARLKVTEAAQWLKDGAPGRAAEALNIALQEFERADQVEREQTKAADPSFF